MLVFGSFTQRRCTYTYMYVSVCGMQRVAAHRICRFRCTGAVCCFMRCHCKYATPPRTRLLFAVRKWLERLQLLQLLQRLLRSWEQWRCSDNANNGQAVALPGIHAVNSQSTQNSPCCVALRHLCGGYCWNFMSVIAYIHICSVCMHVCLCVCVQESTQININVY